MYKFIKIRHDIIRQCHWNYKEMNRTQYKLTNINPMTLYKDEMLYSNNQIHVYGSNIVGSRRPENNVCWLALPNIWKGAVI